MQLVSDNCVQKGLYVSLVVAVILQFFFVHILSNIFDETSSFVPLSTSHVAHQEVKYKRQHVDPGLICSAYGGPSDSAAAEMVYWKDTPSDWDFVSPLKAHGPTPKYLVFELDIGGWNNVRMATETAVAMAAATGRILVLPPMQTMNKLNSTHNGQKAQFQLQDFFDLPSMQQKIPSLEIISMKEFLNREGLAGHLHIHAASGDNSLHFPPHNRTNWDGMLLNSDGGGKMELFQWLRTVTRTVDWDCDKCIAGFPMHSETTNNLQSIFDQSMASIANKDRRTHVLSYNGHPTPVDASTDQRLLEVISSRSDLCLYDESMQQEKVITLMGDNNSKARMLVHFYAFLFFESWQQDLWTKRLIRDHLRYKDEIMCAAARVVEALRCKAKRDGNSNGNFYSMHVRRGDFQEQFRDTRADPTKLLQQVQDVFPKNATIYIATDEKDLHMFDVFRQHFHVFFLSDFSDILLASLNTNFHGMVEELVASRGSIFMGTFYSTFTGYINRLRGYHSQKEMTVGYENGELQSFYLVPTKKRNVLREYQAIQPPVWAREYPIAWRDIDRRLDSTKYLRRGDKHH